MITDNYNGIIRTIHQASHDTFCIEIFSDLKKASPGQFISILCPNKTLRRPFSIAGFEEKEKTLKILFKLKGEGTNYLKSLKQGDKIEFLAPLGNGFEILDKKSLLVGAGIGIAPMLYLKNVLDEKNINNYLITGFKKEDEIIKGSDENVIGGSVLDRIDDLIKEKQIEVIYSCGPHIVLEKLSQIAKKHSIISQLALEKVMACGIGVCRGCIIKIKKDNKIENASICKDGPVFKGDEIIWNG